MNALGKRIATSSGGWKNPYVTDGLVAMWDGEWNTGPGMHDPNATVWKDVITASEISLLPTTVFFEDKYLNTLSTSDKIGIIQSNRVINTLKSDCFSLEIIASKDKLSGSGDVGFFVHNKWNSYIINGSDRSNPPNVFLEIGGIRGNITKSYPVDFSFSATLNNSIVSIFHKGILIISDERTIMPTEDVFKEISIGERSATTICGKIFCIRIYNRNISLDKIQSNYLVDKARFNLTDEQRAAL